MPRKTQVDPRIIEVYRTIGENIIRKRGTMTQDDLAKAARLARGTIVAAEAGQGCSLESLIQIADALGCKPADLFITDAERKEVSYQHIQLMELMKKAFTGK